MLCKALGCTLKALNMFIWRLWMSDYQRECSISGSWYCSSWWCYQWCTFTKRQKYYFWALWSTSGLRQKLGLCITGPLILNAMWNQCKQLWRTSSEPENAHNIGPSANTTHPVAVAIAKGGVFNSQWLVSMGMMLFLAQWYYNHAQLQRETTESGWIFRQAVSYILAKPSTFLLC